MRGSLRRVSASVLVTSVLVAAVVTLSSGAAGAAAPEPDIGVSQAFSPTNPTASDLLTFTYTVTNHGTAPALGVGLVVFVNVGPNRWRVVSGDQGCTTQTDTGTFADQVMTCPVGDLGIGQSATRVVTYRAQPGDYSREVRVAETGYMETGPAAADNDSTVAVHVAPSPNPLVALLDELLAALHL